MDSEDSQIKEKLKKFKKHNKKNNKTTDSFVDTTESDAKTKGGLDYAFKDNLGGGTVDLLKQGGYAEQGFTEFGSAVRGDEWGGKLDYAFNDKTKGGLDYAFKDNLGGGTSAAFGEGLGGNTDDTFKKGGHIEQGFNKLGDKMRTDEYGGKLDYAFKDNLAGGTEAVFGKGGEVDKNFIQPVGQAVTGFFESSGGFNAYHADQVPRYIPPYIKRRLDSQKKKELNMAKIMAGTGPISMFIIQVLDFSVDLVVNIISILTELFTDGFDFAYGGLLGEYQGIFPEKNAYGTSFSFRFFRTFITIITPPVGVFMAKGIKGWMNILICLILCYIHYVIGILYAFVITFRNRYADRYEKIQEEKMAAIKAEQAAAGQGTPTDYAYVVGGFLFVAAIIGVFIFVLRYI